MEIKDTHIHNQNLFIPSIDESLIEDIKVDLDSKPNVFTRYSETQKNTTAPILSSKKTANKRLNTMDNQFWENQTCKDADSSNQVNHVWRGFKAVFRGAISKIPVLNYFILKDKQTKLKATIEDLNSINHNVDELINTPSAEENVDRYQIISQNIIKANEIHSNIIKEIND